MADGRLSIVPPSEPYARLGPGMHQKPHKEIFMKPAKPFIEKKRQIFWLSVVLFALAPVMILIALTVGSAHIPLADAAAEVWRFFMGEPPANSTYSVILFNLRLPRAVLSYLVGAGLSICGAVMQGIFQNPMADPHLLGVSSGAAFGASVGLLLGAGTSVFGLGLTAVAAFAGGIGAVLLVHMLSSHRGRATPGRLLLAGIAMTSLLSSAISGMMILSRDKIERIVQWTMGSFTSASWDKALAAACFILPLSVVLAFAGKILNALALGDEPAMTLGIRVETARRVLLVLSTLITAAAVSVSGIIGFVGLVVPHAARMLLGGDYRGLLPVSFLAGGLFLCLMDTLARTMVSPLEVPVGILTSLIGGVFFLILMRRTGKQAL